MAKRRQPRDPPTLERVVPVIAQLRRSDKEELLVILQAMLEAEEDEEQPDDEQTLKDRTQRRGPLGGRGHYERKIINGCGPYLYLRYWSGGKHRSVYIGKVK